jgi:hemoglobin
MTDYERIGGRAGLESLIEVFIDRVFDDFIIGFLFIGKDRARIVRHEIEHAAAHLGGPSEYTGRSIPAVHRPLRINAGHFRRRLAILRTVLSDRGVDSDIVERWVASNQRLEASVTDGTDCLPREG